VRERESATVLTDPLRCCTTTRTRQLSCAIENKDSRTRSFGSRACSRENTAAHAAESVSISKKEPDAKCPHANTHNTTPTASQIAVVERRD
jgi:hypothetical protein